MNPKSSWEKWWKPRNFENANGFEKQNFLFHLFLSVSSSSRAFDSSNPQHLYDIERNMKFFTGGLVKFWVFITIANFNISYKINWIFWELFSEEHKFRQSSLHLKVPFKSYIQYNWKKDFIKFKIHILGAVFWLIAKRMIKSFHPPYPARWGINHSLI